MLASAQGKFIRGSGRKIRQVVDLIRGMKAGEALSFLKFVNKRPVYYVSKVLHSAIANAKIKGLNVEDLVISNITKDFAAYFCLMSFSICNEPFGRRKYRRAFAA